MSSITGLDGLNQLLKLLNIQKKLQLQIKNQLFVVGI